MINKPARMVRKLSFKADPPSVYHTFEYHHKKAEKDGYLKPSVDTDTRRNIIVETAESLISLYEIPDDFNIFFLRNDLILNKTLAEMTSGDIVISDTKHNRELYKKMTNNIISLSADPLDPSIVKIREGSLLCYEDIDWYTGQKISYDIINKKLDMVSKPVFHVDISLSAPSEVLDFENICSYFFKTKFGFGMNPGICIWLAKHEVLNKVMTLYNKYVNSPPESIHYNKKQSVQFDCSIAHVYVLGRIVSDMYNRGIKIIRNEIKYKSIILYNAIKDSKGFEPIIKTGYFQSENILCASTQSSQKEVNNFFSKHGVELDVLKGESGGAIIRVANYPVHSKEQIEYLADLIVKF
jgi:phosphoserine aminotransferase